METISKMNDTDLEEIQNFIITGRLDKALDLLIEFCRKKNSDSYEEVILLSTQFHILDRKERIGLGEFNQEVNRIAKSILQILMEEKKNQDKRMLAANKEGDSPIKIEDRLSNLELKLDNLIKLIKHNNVEPGADLEKEYFWRNLELSSKNYLYSSERTFYQENLFDYSSVVIQYSKTIESEIINKVYIPYEKFIKDLGGNYDYSPNLQSGPEKNTMSFTQMINGFIQGIRDLEESEISLGKFLENRFSIVNKSKLIEDLNDLIETRNRAVHVGVITKMEAETFRNNVLSILKNLLNRPYEIKWKHT